MDQLFVVTAGLAGLILLAVAFLPAVIAFYRDHKYRWPIFIISVFFGWTLIGFVIALVWAVMPKGKLS